MVAGPSGAGKSRIAEVHLRDRLSKDERGLPVLLLAATPDASLRNLAKELLSALNNEYPSKSFAADMGRRIHRFQPVRTKAEVN
jgi:hypothetical protein